MWLVAELFEQLPEVGDLDKPKLLFFFDEAHLLFDGATPAFVESVAQTVRLIRSKGVGVFFVTQTPRDVPSDVLGQLLDPSPPPHDTVAANARRSRAGTSATSCERARAGRCSARWRGGCSGSSASGSDPTGSA
jgi:hypothetical protein